MIGGVILNSQLTRGLEPKQSLLSSRETLHLLKLSKQGCLESRNVLVESNVRLVSSIVKQFRAENAHFSQDDLFQIGVIGLIKSIKNFDIDKGFQFSTYATHVIKGEIQNYLRGSCTMKINRKTHENSKKINNFLFDYSQKNQKEPTYEEVMEALEIDKKEVILAMNATKNVLSLSKKLNNESSGDKGGNLEDIIADQSDTIEQWENFQYMKSGLDNLEIIEQTVIELKYYLDKTQSEIGLELNMPQWKVSRIERRALRKLGEILGNKEDH
jgi:RNA polymerase sporulation-specific sigma factor